jgi:hypothetical protein
MRRPLSRIALMALLAVTTAACGDDSPTTPTTTPTVTTITETYTGTLQRNGGLTFTFNNTSAGTLTAQLTSVDPDTATAIGLALGTWSPTQGACQIILANDAAFEGVTVVGTTTASASLCVRIYDPKGELSTPIAFTITVNHP